MTERPVHPTELDADAVRVLRFGAVTRNAHRIHYDAGLAGAEGLDAPVVMAQLHGCGFFRAAAEWVGDPAAVLSVSWRNRAPAPAGSRLVVTGTVREVRDDRAVLDLEQHCDGDTVCCHGSAVVRLPSPEVP
ncbi:acyl dehydratase [Amycolatopsis cihanbeyliensis]|uniref:3-methylfumaryl-CoA hydratase n=1 Tax=Amycolatopsis cihanbeyliensis TaxID=1128664 RepID=A0A542DR67_AMYCI|nr:acyl dehydratase [Amycolatopsis cihanbeyliensis]TQJ05577.1 3-methylfumaryl-CoA hydratase [Amycolatopsis cihanbeyliensis]